MADYAVPDSALVHRANLNIAAAVVAKFGSSASDSLIGRAIDEVRASHSVGELAGSGGMSMVVGAVETFLARNSDADRPRNLYGADAARAAQASGAGQHAWHGEGTGQGRYGPLLGGGRSGRDPGADSEGSAPGGSASRGSGGNPNSGTGSEPAGSAFWGGTAKGMLLTRGYANDNDMGWAPTDLMRMGRPALQALKESGLKGDGYKALHDPSGLRLDNGTIVAGAAGYMKRNGINHNEAAKSSAAVDRLKMPADMRERHRVAVEGIHTATPENEGQRKEDLKKSGDEIVQHDPAHKAAVERERRGYKVDQDNALKADATARKDGAAAKKDEAKAGHQAQTAQKTSQQLSSDRQAAQASKNKLGAALN